MSGYHTVLMVERLRAKADSLGFMLCYPKHGWGAERGKDYVAIRPKDQDSLPIYSRDAELFCGTLDDLHSFINGLEWARDYDRMLRVSTPAKRERKEQDERNRKLVALLKDEKTNDVKT